MAPSTTKKKAMTTSASSSASASVVALRHCPAAPLLPLLIFLSSAAAAANAVGAAAAAATTTTTIGRGGGGGRPGRGRGGREVQRTISTKEAAAVRRRDFPPSSLGYAGQRWHDDRSSSSSSLLSVALTVRGGAVRGRNKSGNKKRVSPEDDNDVSSSSPSSTPPSSSPPRWSFPVRPSELPLFSALSVLMFLFIYVFTTVRDTKDTLIVSSCGAESIPLLKLYGVTPAAALFIVLYGRASDVLGRDALFHWTLLPFFVFYALFGFVLYPLRETMHFPLPDGTIAIGMAARAASLLRYWSYSLYFIVSELWASAGVPLLFWQIANDVTSLDRAKRFYPLFAVLGNLAPVVSGLVMSGVVGSRPDDDAGFGGALKVLAGIKVGVCAAILVLYRTVYACAEKEGAALGTPAEDTTKEVEPANKTKKRTSLVESVRTLSQNSALRSMATMVLCYNVCIELTEVLWKALLRKSFPSKSSYMTFMASFSQTVGYVALVLQLCASTIIRVLGWKWSAMLTPLAMVLLAVPFFVAVALGSDDEDFGVPLNTALLIGTVQNVISKVTKYSLFDPTKEMAYIPLGRDAKVRGKAAVDVLGARLGRALGSACQQALVFTVGGGDVSNCAGALGVAYATAVGSWTRAVNVLAGVFDDDDDDADEKGRGQRRGGKDNVSAKKVRGGGGGGSSLRKSRRGASGGKKERFAGQYEESGGGVSPCAGF